MEEAVQDADWVVVEEGAGDGLPRVPVELRCCDSAEERALIGYQRRLAVMAAGCLRHRWGTMSIPSDLVEVASSESDETGGGGRSPHDQQNEHTLDEYEIFSRDEVDKLVAFNVLPRSEWTPSDSEGKTAARRFRPSRVVPSLVNVRLPVSTFPDIAAFDAASDFISQAMLQSDDFWCFAPLFPLREPDTGRFGMWVRVSVALYTELRDIERLASMISELVQKL